MPVNTPCQEWDNNISKWTKCRTVADGEEAVKDAATAYLPMLGGQDVSDYSAYKNRALFYGATGRTIKGLLGGLMRKDPLFFNTTSRMDQELDSVTQLYQSSADLISNMLLEVLTVGRVGALIDAPIEEGGVPYISLYKAESIINWRTQNTGAGVVLTLVVLQENYNSPGEDDFVAKERIQYRVLELIENSYQQRVFRSKDAALESEFYEVPEMTVFPQIGNRRLEYIPFMFINTDVVSPVISTPPLLSLVNVNLSHYRTSADLEHGRHFCGCPTAVLCGFPDDEEYKIGSQVAWVNPDSEASAKFLEFTGQGLGSLEKALEEKEKQMAVLGAKLLESEKQAPESGYALSVRHSGENSILSSIARNISRASGVLFSWLLEWRGVANVNVEVEVNSDFVNERLTSEEITALINAWTMGSISWDTLYFNFKRGELYPEGQDPELEQSMLEQQITLDTKSYTDKTTPPTDGEE